MKQLLLDTHIWLWYLLDETKLTPGQRTAIEDEKNQLWLSPISVWEALLLHERGRIYLSEDPEEWIKLSLRKVPMHEAPITFEIATRSRRIILSYNDPADRFLVATAEVQGLVLVTSDDKIRKESSVPTL